MTDNALLVFGGPSPLSPRPTGPPSPLLPTRTDYSRRTKTRSVRFTDDSGKGTSLSGPLVGPNSGNPVCRTTRPDPLRHEGLYRGVLTNSEHLHSITDHRNFSRLPGDPTLLLSTPGSENPNTTRNQRCNDIWSE